MNKMFYAKGVLAVVVCVALLASTSVSGFAGAVINSPYWDCVDSGKHCDVDGDSKYMSYISSGMTAWNNSYVTVFRDDSGSVLEDVYVTDKTSNGSYYGYTWSNGRMEFYTSKMDNFTSTQKYSGTRHELGHALGCGHNTTTDVMYSSIRSFYTLSNNDIASFTDAYTNHY
jgi:predicted Zn-dependent protease